LTNRRQSEARNFKTAQHTNKQIKDASSKMNALQNGTKLGGITAQGFDATYEKLINYK